MSAMAEQAINLLDFNQRLDINLLDNVVNLMYNGVGVDQKVALEVLTRLKQHPDAWTRVDTILEYSSNQETKYYALQILEELIKTRWKALPAVQRDGIKKFIVGVIIKTSQDPVSLENERMYLNKLNIILVQILKREWPRNWESFIPDIVGASKTNECLCHNNMAILKLLSEEVFDFSPGEITQTKAKHMKDSMCSQFSQVFELCQFVLDNSTNVGLVSATLETLLRFLNWIPLGYIFETELINTLVKKFLPVPAFRNITLKCLTEISGIFMLNYDKNFVMMFSDTMEKLQEIMPPCRNIRIADAYARGNNSEQQFIQNLSLFLCTYLKEHRNSMEACKTSDIVAALEYIYRISEVEDVEVFKICLEYWHFLTYDLYRESPIISSSSSPMIPSINNVPVSTRYLYESILTKVRVIMISRMAKPEEVLVVENEHGEVVREFMKDTDAINLYKTMRETLVYLTHLDCSDTERIMTEKLQNQVNGVEWSWKSLNRLCWAIGSISGAMHEEDEKRFIVTVIKELLGLCEHKRGKDNKAIIASNIMYVVGQYPRFLRAHWKFLKTVVNKLFEFMHETHSGVQDMACDTFIKIAQKCRRHFVNLQIGEVTPFINEILSTTPSIVCDLQPQQVQTFYEAVGYMISAQIDGKVQEELIETYMAWPNSYWDDTISRTSANVNVLRDMGVIKQLISILKTNVRACKALGHPYVIQLGRIYLDMLNVYKVMSETISQAISENGETVTKQPMIKGMRVVKKETLKLIGGWIASSTNPQLVLDNFIPPLMDAVLMDYNMTPVPSAREPEVLSTMSAIVGRLENHITPWIPKIFDAVFECTLSMINKDFEEFPEHRTNFFTLLQSVNSHCFPALLAIPPPQFKLVLDSIIWAFKHTMRNVAETGLQILHTMLLKIAEHDAHAQSFYKTYFTDILQHIFSVVSDTSHTANLGLHSNILAYMFDIVESGSVKVPLYPDAIPMDPKRNVLYIQEFVANLLKSAFPHLTDNQVKVTVQGLFQLTQDHTGFKEHLRDFLVQIRDFTGEDDSDLFLEEREAHLREAEEQKKRFRSSVPGILGPHEDPEDMQD